MQILNSGFGQADTNTIVRPENPQRRDVMIMPPGSDDRPSWLVIQWDADNPGVWYVSSSCPSMLSSKAVLTSRKASTLPLLLAFIPRSRHQRLGDTECDFQGHGTDGERAHGADVSWLEFVREDAKVAFDGY